MCLSIPPRVAHLACHTGGKKTTRNYFMTKKACLRAEFTSSCLGFHQCDTATPPRTNVEKKKQTVREEHRQQHINTGKTSCDGIVRAHDTGETKFGQIQVWPRVVTKFGQTKFGQDQVWPDQLWPRPSLARPSLAKTKVWPRPSLAKTKFGQDQVWPDQVRDNQYSPCFCEGVAGRRPATPSHKHGLCPPFVSTGLHVEQGLGL